MSAIETVLQVIEWAIANQETPGMPPQGDLSGIEELGQPSRRLVQVLAELCVVSTAQLRWSMPPLGDHRPLSMDNVIIAAALGTTNGQLARTLLRSVPVPSCSGDWVVRYGLITPALPFLPAEIADDCRQLSPLTAIFNRPIVGQETQSVNDVSQLLSHHAAKLSLTLHLARPTREMAVRNWHTELLERLRIGEQNFVIDVYEAAMIYYPQLVISQIREAYSVISDQKAASNEELLRDALSIAKWWQPLWAIERADVNRLRTRRYLGYDYREGVRLFNLAHVNFGF